MKEIGKNWSINFRNCDGVHSTNVIKTLAKVSSNKERNLIQRIINDRKRGGRLTEQGSHNLSKSKEGSVSKHIMGKDGNQRT